MPELHHHSPFQLEQAHPESKGTICTHRSHAGALPWDCNTYPNHVPLAASQLLVLSHVTFEGSGGILPMENQDPQQSPWPPASVRAKSSLGSLSSKLKTRELHLCMVENGCKDLCPEASKHGTHLERSGLLLWCFFPLSSQHKRRGPSCCHLSSHRDIPSASSSFSQPPSTQAGGCDGTGLMPQMVPRGLSPPPGLQSRFLEHFSSLEPLMCRTDSSCSAALSFLALHPRAPMTDPLHAPAHTCILQSSLEKRQLLAGLFAVTSIIYREDKHHMQTFCGKAVEQDYRYYLHVIVICEFSDLQLAKEKKRKENPTDSK